MNHKSKSSVNQTSLGGVSSLVHCSHPSRSFNFKTMREIWKDIPGYEGHYLVSSLGRIRSKKPRRENVLIPRKTRLGYVMIALYKNAKREDLSIHRIVAQSFIPNPLNKPEVNHKDGIKDNNIAENLEWSTRKENVKHSWEHGLAKTNSRQPSQYSKDGNYIKTFETTIEAGLETGTDIGSISKACNGKQKTAGGFIWRYEKPRRKHCEVEIAQHQRYL